MADLKSLNAALKSKSFDPVYLFVGDDDFRKDGALKAVIEAAVEPATRDFNCEVRRGSEVDAETLGSLLATPPMLAERRFVAVRDVGGLRKDARAALDRYLARPASDTILVLVAPAGAKPDKTLADRATVIDFKPLDGGKLSEWLASYARRELGAELAPGVADLLVSAVGNDLQQLTGELDKLASYARGQAVGDAAVVTEQAVADVVGVRRGETLGDLLDAVARRDATTALGLVDHVLSQPKASAVVVVMALSTQFLALAWGQAMRARGTNPGQLAREYWTLLKEGGAYPGRPWGEAVNAWTATVDRWTAPALDRALDLLLDADAALKETRVSTDEQLLASLVLSLCA
ncbi:DNA polymerase III, delta subunit [Gemmatirosa kalamazoonensis]|uniref:DNA polymerase III subunit delta n=1 Tax=Gemmatirosa kalamazoonensis TaxID=861299 RepID=W0RDC4_9BACT|nr:DNA polymerase III subunit delta [Gemmatirosa kalamazoonensis]AHG88442.1 DNA polymerase III, delta subunit [Gemmatirosa kalamazoonensis]